MLRSSDGRSLIFAMLEDYIAKSPALWLIVYGSIAIGTAMMLTLYSNVVMDPSDDVIPHTRLVTPNISLPFWESLAHEPHRLKAGDVLAQIILVITRMLIRFIIDPLLTLCHHLSDPV